MAKKAGLPDLKEEALLWERGSAFVFGVDEAGRGCLAGPVCAAATCWAPHSAAFSPVVEVRDSKLMTHLQREKAFDPIRKFALAKGVGFASAPEIDRWNIFRATHLAIARALEGALQSLSSLGVVFSHDQLAFLIDGNQPMVTKAQFFVGSGEYEAEFPLLKRLYEDPIREFCFVKGDSKVFSIASASVLAKVARDRHMMELDRAFPHYEFSLHKGYSTARHIENLMAHGPCSEHRRSFSPVSEALALFS